MQRVDVYDRRYDESTDQTTANTCPECDGRVTMNVAETVCDDCGLVLADEGVDLGPEWRSFEADDASPARTGAPRTPARHDRGLSTEIGWTKSGAHASKSARERRRLGRLRTQHSRAQFRTKAERNEMHGLAEIKRLTGALELSTAVRDQACRLFSTAQEQDLLRGRSIESMAAASVYAACRCASRPHSIGDIEAVSAKSEEPIQHCFGVLNRELGLPVPPRDPTLFLARFCSDLGFSQAVERRAGDILDSDRTPDTRGANPAAVAAGAILVAARESNETAAVTQGAVADVADVCVPTVRRYRDELQAL
jgi:transcription initiation factor TFIIB